MRTLLSAVCCLLIPAAASAQSPADIIARAVTAHGGDAVAKMKYVAHSSKGRVNLLGVDVPAVRSARWALPERAYWDLEFTQAGTKLRTRIAIVGVGGWQQVNNSPAADLPPAAFDTMAEEAWLFWLVSVAPLSGKGLAFGPAEPATVNGEPALGVVVTKAGRPDVYLWFSKATGLLVKARFRGSDGGQPTTKEFVFSGHKEFEGVKLPTRLVDYANNIRMGDWEITEWKFSEKLNAEDFKKPN
jgi:hypothetical protein